MLKRTFTAIAWAFLVGLATAVVVHRAEAQNDRYENQVRFQLNLVNTFAESVGFENTHDYRIGSLQDDQSDDFTVTLRENWEYRIISLCDADCSDIDLFLEDENGNDIDSDTGTNDAPIITVRPKWTGTFSVRVRMYECSAEPCYFGIGVFGRQQ